MAEVIIMPKLGFDMDEGQLVKWYKAPGEPVSVGELFFEINTDKTAMPVESPIEGTVLKLLLEEGDFAAVFTPIAVVGNPDEDADAALAAYGQGSSEFGIQNAEPVDGETEANSEFGIRNSESQDGNEAPRERLKLTPRARKFFADNAISMNDVALVKGTGFEGGITETDLIAANLTAMATTLGVSAAVRAERPAPKSAAVPEGQEKTRASAAPQIAGDKLILSVAPYRGIRKIIGDKLSESMIQSPHIYFTDEVDTEPMTRFRADVSEALGEKISVTDVLVMAASRALVKYPGVNSSLVGSDIVTYGSTNIGVAVAGEKGLIVPVIRDVQLKKISEVAEISRALIERARAGSLSPDEYSGGTFTISNLGMFGIANFTAIINPPEAAIMAISAAKKKPVVVTDRGIDQIVVKSIMNIQLSVDHRLIDGLLAAQFVAYFKELLENPLGILFYGTL